MTLSADNYDAALEHLLEEARAADDPLGALHDRVVDSSDLATDLPLVMAAVTRLRGAAGCWSALTETLLWACHATRGELLSAVRQGAELVEDIDGLRAEASAALGTPVSADADPALVEPMIAVLDEYVAEADPDHRDLSVAIAARAFAVALDDCCSDTFPVEFKARIEYEIIPGRAYPVHCYDPTGGGEYPRLVAGSANTPPDRDPYEEIEATRHLRLGDDDAEAFSIRIYWDLHFHLQPLSNVDRLRIATCHPNLSLAEFDLDIDGPRHHVRNLLRRRPRDEDTDEAFQNHGPSDPDEQHRILAAQLATAADAGAHVVIIPEYCLHDSEHDRLRETVDELSPQPLLIVAGTSEAVDEHGHLVNQACIWAPSGPARTLPKNFPAEMDGRVEDVAVEPRPVVILWQTGRWRFAVLVCRDAAPARLITQLARAGVNLCLVPACSNRIATIAESALELRTRSQAFVALANTPAVWTLDRVEQRPDDLDRYDAAFDGPYEHPPYALYTPSGEAHYRGDSRGIWVFDGFERTAKWYDAPT